MTLLEFLSAIADFAKLKAAFWPPSSTHRRAEIVLTGQGPQGLLYDLFLIDDGCLSFEADQETILSKDQVNAATAFRRLPARRRTLSYYDNDRRESPFLVFLFHGLGLDQDDYRSLLLETELHGLAPTLYGFHPWDEDPLPIPVNLHCRLMAQFVEHHAAKQANQRIVLIGFSTGADLLFDLVPLLSPETTGRAHGILLLDPNINQSTCFISGELSEARKKNLSPLELSRALGAEASDINEWLDKHRYLVRVLGKFHGNLNVLYQFANDIFVANETFGASRFAGRVATLLSIIENGHIVLSGGALHCRLLPQIEEALAEHHGCALRRLTWAQGTTHFELLNTDFLREAIEDVLANTS